MNLHEKENKANEKKHNNKLVEKDNTEKVHETRLQLQILYMSRNKTEN